MIANDRELETTQERIAYFQGLLRQFRVGAKEKDFPLMAGGYIAEVEKMHREVMNYHVGQTAVVENGAPLSELATAK